MIEIKITGTTKAELLKNLNELTETLSGPTDWKPEAQPVKEVPKPKAKPTPKPEAETASEPEPEAAPEPDKEAAELTVSKADVQKVLSEMVAQQPEKKPKIKALFTKYEATKISNLAEEKYADFLEELEVI
ncbi:MAG: hypothetical protein LKF36_15355 [Lactobacillus sp.]|jgi:hypothetical protein|nr:hypothetical protein [Lactobacillus sp.]